MEIQKDLEAFKGKTFVIKYGGSIMENKFSQEAFFQDILALNRAGINIVIVHGGGPEISKWLKKVGIASNFINGLRITDESTIEIAEMVLSGKINKNIACSLNINGIKAIGISGRDNNLITVKRKYLNIDGEPVDIGFVGEVEAINKDLIFDLLNAGYVPIISPIGCDKEGNKYNINADYVASYISSSLKAEKLIILTDVQGIYKDINDKSTIINSITTNEIKDYIDLGIINGGMIPKMECCIDALEKGTKKVYLIDGRKEHSLINNIFSNYGTTISLKGEMKNDKN
ncbi:acetylglutamate kinase [Clostridium tetanomorphum]|uniref:Acetylglutamate kinase n=1 Tax=Clostridium tetanomorphum TaxID=1553 RepID=A0A923ECS4_CLOTT|nr:acetylglutamate kinase [Clostridium tetanomorphum]KAJ49530.1 Acetylglutamate kinase [Clostridium tetanomorphum DSM 665]KAJ52186.1 Acetylglutamate kinase [Clostridium tetanomorphum DSM 665]MBC2398956.1 acetylglutamate kinase [Clostridium tetanomorphum]MBP1866371.1 acetylglutamate kinase [Clostridium tetanomorphum]NRS86548.1 acetylglutamate kinase [Clostridium tetanomorphum]